MNEPRYILVPRPARPYWRVLALLMMVLLAMLESVAHAEGAAPKWGLDRMLSKAAPGLAKKMNQRAASQAGVDTNLGYPYYTSQKPAAGAVNPVANNPNVLANRIVAPTAAPTVAQAPNPLATRSAAIAPLAAAPTPFARPTENSQVNDLLADANAIEAQLQQRENMRLAREQKRVALRQMNAAPETYAASGNAAGRLLSSLQNGPSENAYRAEALRKAQQDAQYVAQERNLRARGAQGDDLYPVAASGEADTSQQVSSAIRGGASQSSPVKLAKYQVFISDGYLNRHSAASQEDSSPDEVGGVRHLRHSTASDGGTSSNPFNNSSKKSPASSSSASSSDSE